MNWLDTLKSRTIWAGVGLWGLALYQLTQGHVELAAQSFLAGLAAWGLRVAVSQPVAVEVTEVPAPAQPATPATATTYVRTTTTKPPADG